MIGVDSSRPPRPATDLNLEGLTAATVVGLRASSALVVVSGILLVIIFIVHGGQVQGVSERTRPDRNSPADVCCPASNVTAVSPSASSTR